MLTMLAQTKTDLGKFSLTDKGFTANFGNDPAGRLEQILSSFVSIFTIFAGIAFLIYFLIGAVTWITSGGQPEPLDKAKRQMSTAFVGLFVTVAALGIIYVLGKVTGLDILNLTDLIENLGPK